MVEAKKPDQVQTIKCVLLDKECSKSKSEG